MAITTEQQVIVTNKPVAKIMTITPELAKKWLSRNVGNRSFRPYKAKWFARLIENGEFVLTHQGIAFDDDGNLIDGQHRLSAIVMTGKSVQMFVSKGFNRNEVITAIDLGAKRNTADSLRIKHGGDTLFNNTVVSICREVVRLLRGHNLPTEGEIEKFCFTNEELLTFAKHIKSVGDNKVSSPVLLACIAASVNGVEFQEIERICKLIYKNEIDVFVKGETNTAILNAAPLVKNVRQNGSEERRIVFERMKAIIHAHQKNLKRIPKDGKDLYPIKLTDDLRLIRKA